MATTTDVILVDTNVLIDVMTGDVHWCAWSTRALNAAKATDEVTANDVIYAELAFGYANIDDLDAALGLISVAMRPIPREALFLAGLAHKRYRQRGGTKTGVLSDFFIGAHASVAATALVTRDTRRYRAYFPELTLVAPEGE